MYHDLYSEITEDGNVAKGKQTEALSGYLADKVAFQTHWGN